MVFQRRSSLSSDSSAVSVDCIKSTPKTHLHHHNNNTSRKSVHFDLSANKEYRHYVDKETWYKHSDYQFFKSSTRKAVQALKRAEEAQSHNPSSYERVMEYTYDTCCREVLLDEKEISYTALSTARERRRLYQWTKAAPSRLGLEKFALRRIIKERKQRRFEMIDFIYDIQEVVQGNEDDRAEFIRLNCERTSRPSRMFAQALAQAHSASSDE